MPSATPHPSTPDPIVGIDLGTTNSLVAIANWPTLSPPHILNDAKGRAMLPSVVRFDLSSPPRPVELGFEARQSALLHPLSTVASVKRLMGRSIADAAADLPYLSFQVVQGPGNTARVALPTASGAPHIVSPQEVSAIILRALREQASAQLGVPVTKAVVTVPAYFDDAQRQATRDAGRLAGLDVVRIINEPTAAALAYGLGLRQLAGADLNPRVVVVFDLGGGTFDVSILRITPAPDSADATAADCFQVLSTSGDTHLGGDDFDQTLVALFTREITERFGPMTFPPETLQALRQFAEATKIKLSDTEQAAIRIDLGQGRIYDRTITRVEYESLIAPLVDRAIDCCTRALRDAKKQMHAEEIAAVILVGGATRTPLVRARVQAAFGLEPYTALNPDEVVALGAAVQASVLAGSSSGGRKSLLLDVVPLSLGLETVGGAMAKLIIRNSTVPCRASERFSTSVDNQTGITLNVLQGEREMAADCRSLGTFELKGIPPMPAGIPKLLVEFAVDASGILTVHAVEERSGKRLRAQIVPNHGLSPDEVDRLERESFINARDDMIRHRVADLITNTKLDLHWITRQLDKLGPVVPADLRADLTTRIDALRAMITAASADYKTIDPNALHQAKEALDRASMRLHELSIAQSLQSDTPPSPKP
ncbi:MAG: Hsp70 family protein [Phycisphaerales bacterium]|nr:Hsp70 family protein [Phycisphaerales bacterium]